jgi:hypothetical protein
VIAEPRHGLGLAANPKPGIGIQPIGLQQRQRNLPIQPGVTREIDPFLRTFADLLFKTETAAAECGWQLRSLVG